LSFSCKKRKEKKGKEKKRKEKKRKEKKRKEKKRKEKENRLCEKWPLIVGLKPKKASKCEY